MLSVKLLTNSRVGLVPSNTTTEIKCRQSLEYLKSNGKNRMQQTDEIGNCIGVLHDVNKKCSYHLGTTQCVVSVEILPTDTQHCRNYLYDKSWTNQSYEVEGLQWAMYNRNVHSTMTRSSRFYCLIGVINKPTTDKLWISPVYRPTTSCGTILLVHNVEIAHVTITMPT